MRTIERSSAFKRDYKREAKGPHRNTLDPTLSAVLLALLPISRSMPAIETTI